MIRVGIAGTGSIARAHLAAYQAFAERCQVVALWNRDPARAETVRRDLGLADAVVCTSFDELVAQRLDLVSVCTPPSTHQDLSVRLLRAGTNVLCEKPMAPTLEACEAIRDAQSATAFFSPVAQNRYRDDVRVLAHAHRSGLAGDVAHVQVESASWRGPAYYDVGWRRGWDTAGGGATLSNAVHEIDLLVDLLGMPDAVTAVTTNVAHDGVEVEDLAVAVLRYGRALATLTASVVHHGQERSIVVQGTQARVSLPWRAVAEVAGPDGFPAPGGDRDLVARLDALAAAVPPLRYTGFAGQVDDVLSAIEHGRRPAVDADAGTRAVEVVTAIYASAREDRTVTLPRRPGARAAG